MKILYGVQATGNGHITRARAMNHYFSEFGIEVDYLFSGRNRAGFWDMEPFGKWRCHRGLTFHHKAGKLDFVKTITQNNALTFLKDIRELDLSPYDIVLTDFEPITAWASKRQKKTCIGMGHQYAFSHDAPKRGDDFLPSTIMKNFAPADIGLGLHWHHFNSLILPPIAESHASNDPSDPNKIVVYLGFEDTEEVIKLLEPFDDHLFVFYGPFKHLESRGHIQLKPLSRENFQYDLATAAGVICNAGFELSSEAIQLGKKLLIKPLHGQMEQLSNALALEQLDLGMAMDSLDPNIVREWLDNGKGQKITYPNVARSIAQWLSKGEWDNPESLKNLVVELWEKTDANGAKSFVEARLPQL
ncbi:MAG: hypothetical protein ACI93R_002271 [Flavobacteriales bacterium]|jgi:uncharacterized protein (TIGR00661 family)